MLRDADPIWKRAPSTGFYGMRGKKAPSASFYGVRGKKGPTGFLGVRGKKEHLVSPADLVSMENFYGDMWAKGDGLMNKEKVNEYTDAQYALAAEKRVPAEGFMGLRGKRSLLAKDHNNKPSPVAK